MLINSPDTLIVVGTPTIGPSGMLTVEVPVYIVVPFSLDETLDSLKFVIMCVCGADPLSIIILRFELKTAPSIPETLFSCVFAESDVVV